MNYLAIDTASKIMKVLVHYNGNSKYYQNADFKTASTTLMPEIDSLLGELKCTLADMDFYACTIGPGSFTGIRIGMSTVKAFACTTKKSVVAVNSLELLAYNNSGEETICSVMDEIGRASCRERVYGLV